MTGPSAPGVAERPGHALAAAPVCGDRLQRTLGTVRVGRGDGADGRGRNTGVRRSESGT